MKPLHWILLIIGILLIAAGTVALTKAPKRKLRSQIIGFRPTGIDMAASTRRRAFTTPIYRSAPKVQAAPGDIIKVSKGCFDKRTGVYFQC